MKFDPSPTAIWAKYERGPRLQALDRPIRSRAPQRGVLPRQTMGRAARAVARPADLQRAAPLRQPVCVMLVSDDVAVRAQPFDMDGDGRKTARVLERAFASAIERSGVKALGRPLLKNACVDGDACFYMHFDPALETGQAVKGDIVAELIDSTNICFGNPASDEVQRQPYLILAMRRDVDEVRKEARENGLSATEAEAIVPDDHRGLSALSLEPAKTTV